MNGHEDDSLQGVIESTGHTTSSRFHEGNSLGFADPLRTTIHPTGAAKESGGKPPISLVPSELVLGAARAFDFGAKKYSSHNWRKGIPTSKLYDALQRHLLAWNDGEDVADDSKLDHLDHAAACLAMLMTTVKGHREMDDRYARELDPHKPRKLL